MVSSWTTTIRGAMKVAQRVASCLGQTSVWRSEAGELSTQSQYRVTENKRAEVRTILILSLLVMIVTSSCKSAEPRADMTQLAGYKTDKGEHYHGFTEIYDRILAPLRDEQIRILEIGIAEGGSLELWEDYFPKAEIFGIDILDRSALQRDRVKTFVADQADREQLGNFIAQHGGDFDVIIDDGGHAMDQQQISLGFLFQYLKPGGFYVLEDVHTSFYTDFGVVDNGANSTYTMIFNYIGNVEMKSRYMTDSELRYLDDNIEYVNLFFRNTAYQSITSVFQKALVPKSELPEGE